MDWIGNAIVGMWFIPVTFFILIPLALFTANLFVSGFRRLTGKTDTVKIQHHVA